MSEQFSILIDSRSHFETGAPGGAWLSMPTTQEQLHAAMRSVGITADNPQDFFVGGFANTEDCPFDVPLAVIQSGSMDELNYLGKLLEMQRDEDKAKFAAAVTLGEYAGNLKDLINLAQNLDCYWIYPTVQSEEDYGYYLIDELDELELPEEAKKYFMYEEYGRDAAINDGGRFTEQGYVYNNKNTFSEWYNGRDIPKEYRIMSYPQPTRLDPEKVEMDAIGTRQAATLTTEPPQPQSVIPINLTAEKPAEKLKEITDRLEQGITELFDSERYKEYLRVMSKFHNYSFNNTLLIAMQKPDASLIAGFTAWKNQFQRNVKKGEKGIKIIAPSPFKIKQETEKIDPQTQKPVIGRDGKPVTEEKEITIPAYKVVSVFDVSQTEGKELPDIAVDALTGDVEQYSDFFAALEKTSPVPIGFEKIEGGAHGYYHLEDKRIALDEGMSELQTLKTAIHEIAHAKLHDIDLNAPKDEQQPRVDRRTREVEAESVAYTVCQHYGLDTSDYSFGYVAGWSSGRELAELKSSLETIRSAAADIINSIDGHIAELQKQHEAEKAAPDLAAVQEEQSEKAAPPLTDLQKKAAAIAEKYEALSTQEKIGVIAQAFGDTAGRIETSPCTGKWRGTSDISIRFDNGASLFLGNRLTPKAKTAAVQRELVNDTLLRYNPEIVSATKEAALASLMEREAKDNAIAAQKGLKPYTLLNVEFNDGADSQSSGYMGWYYVTLAVDGNICSHIETGLNYDIADGKVSAEPTREKYFAAGALKDSEVDYVFNNVGFSSASGLYALPVSDAVLQRAEKTLAERTQAQAAQRTEKDVIYTMHTNPRSESLADRSFLQAYEQQPDGKAIPGDLLFVGTPEKCRELLQSLNAGELTQGEVKALYAKAQEPDRDSFSIYQLKRGDETRDLRFEPYDRLTAAGHTVDPANYDLIYSAPLAPGTSLEAIFTRFNIDHPKDFKGHSLSVSDVVVLHQNGQDTAHYVDSIGYRQTPEFLQPQNYLKHVEDIVEQNDNNFDGIINNTPQTPTVGELEQKAKAGEPISLIDLANAIHADKERGKEEKPSIRAQLRAAKEQTAQRKAQRSKTQDLERI
jgi:antirestriction protein ArdC